MKFRSQLKPLLKRIFSFALGFLPVRMRYRMQTAAERLIYRLTPSVHDLPPIFHYWSNKYLRPQFERFGFSSPDQFFIHEILKLAEQRSALNIFSLGSGRCESEIDIALALRTNGFADFLITCSDLSEHVLAGARAKAEQFNLEKNFCFLQVDLNHCTLEGQFDIVLANQSLHHIVELERVFDEVKKALRTLDGSFLICDTIGRNGHMLWPELLEEVQKRWVKLDAARRFDSATGRIEPNYLSYDSSKVGFEGIRAQDILPELMKRFEFELFLPYGGLVVPFVERRMGMNFNVNNSADLAFVDALAERECEIFADLVVKPTQMIAVLRTHKVSDRRLFDAGFTPERCVRPASDD